MFMGEYGTLLLLDGLIILQFASLMYLIKMYNYLKLEIGVKVGVKL